MADWHIFQDYDESKKKWSVERLPDVPLLNNMEGSTMTRILTRPRLVINNGSSEAYVVNPMERVIYMLSVLMPLVLYDSEGVMHCFYFTASVDSTSTMKGELAKKSKPRKKAKLSYRAYHDTFLNGFNWNTAPHGQLTMPVLYSTEISKSIGKNVCGLPSNILRQSYNWYSSRPYFRVTVQPSLTPAIFLQKIESMIKEKSFEDFVETKFAIARRRWKAGTSTDPILFDPKSDSTETYGSGSAMTFNPFTKLTEDHNIATEVIIDTVNKAGAFFAGHPMETRRRKGMMNF